MFMNLTELEISKSLKVSTRPLHLEDLIREHGWKMLGKGIEAAVARHPHKPYALKLFPSHSKYTQFVKLAQQHANNPHMPRFSRYVRPVPGTDWNYVRMELLAEAEWSNLRSAHAAELCVIWDQVQRAKAEGHGIFWNSAVGADNADYMKKLAQEHAWPDVAACAASADPQWTQAVQAVIATMIQQGYRQLDLHYNNMMMRGHTLVITDPFY